MHADCCFAYSHVNEHSFQLNRNKGETTALVTSINIVFVCQ